MFRLLFRYAVTLLIIYNSCDCQLIGKKLFRLNDKRIFKNQTNSVNVTTRLEHVGSKAPFFYGTANNGKPFGNKEKLLYGIKSDVKSLRSNIGISIRDFLEDNDNLLHIETPEELTARWGYKTERHVVQTEDGYLLTIFRIPHGRTKTKNRKGSVIVQHGLFSSSDSWMLRTPDKDLIYMLANHGYDVWLGNSRGNFHSKGHVSMFANDSKYWNFSLHEMGVYDTAAIVDYILDRTGQKNLHYIGYSIGTLLLYILCSTKPHYNEKIRLNINLAPVAFMKPSNVMQNFFLDSAEYFKKNLESQGIHEVFPLSRRNAILGIALCKDGSPTQALCVAFFFLLVGPDFNQTDTTMFPEILKHFPAGSSVEVMEHCKQIMKSGLFRNYDFGVEQNMLKYGSETPPHYNISKVTAPTVIFYGLNDLIAAPSDVIKFAKQHTNLVGMYPIEHKYFNHLEFMWAVDANRLLYDPIIQLMDLY